jgi:putative sigma-54 modulation protein
MKLNFTGKLGRLQAEHQKKLDARFRRLGSLLDRKSEKEAHVILTSERHVKRAEITVNYHDHLLVGMGDAADNFTALLAAIEKLEKQIRKQIDRWRELKRTGGAKLKKATVEIATPSSAAVMLEEEEQNGPRVYRVNNRSRRKPMTVDEAMLEMDSNKDYLVYLDAETDRVSVLLRRRDGNFDLIEA